MKTVLKYLNSLLILFSLLWLTGCADDTSIHVPDIGQDGNGDVILSLNVSISNSQGGTRTYFSNPENPLEKIHSLRVIVVNAKDTVEHNLRVDMPNGVGVDKVGELEFKVSTKYGTTQITDKNQMIQTEKKRIYLIANEDAIPSGDDLPKGMVDIRKILNENLNPGANFLQNSAKFIVIWNKWKEEVSGNANTLPEYATPFINNEGDNKKYVLMSEFFDVDVTSNLSVGGDQITKANLFITRNLVKFRFLIHADKDTPSFKVNKIIFSNLMQKEYLFPNDAVYMPDKYDIDGKVSIENREILSYKTPSFSHGDDGNLVRPYIFNPENFGFNATSSSPNNAFLDTYEPNLYFCETRNLVKSDTDDTVSESQLYTVAIEVEFQNKVKDKDGNEKIVPFVMTFDAKELKDLKLLPRNTIVQVDMTVRKGVLEATATVYPYTAVSLFPDFGFIVEPAGISLDREQAQIAEGNTLWLGTNITPEDATETILTWNSSDETIATVNHEGMVTAVKEGDATISVETTNGLKAECKIKVTPEVKATGITIDQHTATIAQGQTLSLYAQITPGNASNKKLMWSSTNESVATVDNEGVVTAVSPGTTTITAKTSNGLTVSCELEVTQKIEATGITLNRTTATITITVNNAGNITNNSNILLLNATISPANVTNNTLTWTSSNEEVATVENGCVTAYGAGTTTITAETSNGKTATCTVTVTGAQSTVVTLDKAEATIGEGTILYLKATLPTSATNKTLTWSSNNKEVATVENGFVTAVSPGTAIITVKTSNGHTATCIVTVTNVTLDKAKATLKVGDTLKLNAKIAPDNVSGVTMTWSSSDTNVATVSSDGVITAKQHGNTTITVTTSNYATASCEITVQ